MAMLLGCQKEFRWAEQRGVQSATPGVGRMAERTVLRRAYATAASLVGNLAALLAEMMVARLAQLWEYLTAVMLENHLVVLLVLPMADLTGIAMVAQLAIPTEPWWEHW